MKMDKWSTDRQKKIVKFFHIYWPYRKLFTFGLKEWMYIIIGMQMKCIIMNI